MPISLEFLSGAQAWLDTNAQLLDVVYNWCFDLASEGGSPGRIVQGYEPEVRQARVEPPTDPAVIITYVRHPNGIIILRIETWP